MKFKINKTVFTKFPDLVEAVVLIYDFENKRSKEESVTFLRGEEKKLREGYSMDSLLRDNQIVPYVEAFAKFGMETDKYNPSHVALAKRVVEGHDLPDINPMVNVYNACSIKYLTPFGGENLDEVVGDLELRFANGNEQWIAIGATKNKPPQRGELVWIDDLSVTCRAWNWRQCDRTKLTEKAKNGYFILDGFEGKGREVISRAVKEFSEIVRKTLGGRTEAVWLDKHTPEADISFQSKKINQVVEKIDRIKKGGEVAKKGSENKLPLKGSLAYRLMQMLFQAWLKVGSGVKDGLKFEDIKIDHPIDEAHGDYSSNIAMITFAKIKDKIKDVKDQKLGQIKDPFELTQVFAEEIRKIKPEFVDKLEAVAPGHLNIFLSKDWLISKAVELLDTDKYLERLGKTGSGKTMVIDYSAPNIAKPFGVGHLRSTTIGQAIYNLYKTLGWKTIGDNHLGDWGTQFGKMITAIKLWGGGEVAKMSIHDLEKLYVRFHQEAEKDPNLLDEGRKWFERLEKGNREARVIWQQCVEVSLREFNRIYELLEVKIDVAHGESFYESMLPGVVEDLTNNGMTKVSNGATIVELEAMPPAMLLKQDGATTYFTRDIATIKYRVKEWNPDLIVYEVGSEQKLHFRQVFAAVDKLGLIPKARLYHLPHGLLRWATGKFSTRKGDTIHLEAILGEAMERAKVLAQKSGTAKDFSNKEREKIAQAVGIGAIKFNDLKQEPERDIVFDWDKILTLEGYSAPYLQYTYARCKSVMGKVSPPLLPLALSQSLENSLAKGGFNLSLNDDELSLLRTFYRFEETIVEAADRFAPNLVAQYLFELAQRYNVFYQKCRILGQEGTVEQSRLVLTQVSANILKIGLGILGIETVDRM